MIYFGLIMSTDSKHLIADIPQKAILEHDGKVLIVCDDKGKWQLPGGRLHEGEEPIECVKREIQEELGVDVEPLRIFDVFVFTSASGTNHFAVIWICKLLGNMENIKKDGEEVRDLKLISSAEELESLQESTSMWEEYKEVLKKYFNQR